MGSGSKSITTGYNYFGSFAVAVCLGPANRLLSIRNGDTPIWEGPLDVSSADGDGKCSLVTEIGGIDFYWGLPTQNVNPLLEALEIDQGSGPVNVPMPAFKNVVYAVCEDVAFGSQVVPPTLTFEIETVTSGLSISEHEIESEAVIPEAVYDFLTDTLRGAGISADHVDVDSFSAAAETVIDEGLSASPDIDTTESVREIVGRMLSYVDGYLYFHHGKLKIKLIRAESTVGLVSLDESDMLEEPLPLNEGFGATWNQTRVTFRDRENKWEESSEPYTDNANAAIVGQVVTRTFNYPWLTRRDPAKVLARLLGLKGGVPPVFWTLVLKPEYRSLVPGQLLRLNYERFGVVDRVVRVTRVRRGSPQEPRVEIEVQEEATRDTSNDYLPPDDNFTVPGTLDPDGGESWDITSATPRLSWLPEALKEGKEDGVLVAIDRPQATALRCHVWWTWDPDEQEFLQLGEQIAFPSHGEIICWHQIRTNHWLFRVQFDNPVDYDWLQTLAEQTLEVFAVVGQRLYKSVGTPKDEHQVLSPWLQRVSGGRFVLISDTIIDIEFEGEAHGTDDLLLETLGDDGKYPALNIYFGRLKDFFIFPSDTLQFDRAAGNHLEDTALVRELKVTMANHIHEQALADVTAVTYDRNLTTQCADGTYSEDWGDRAPSTYEFYDVEAGAEATLSGDADYDLIEDIDEALGAIHDGTATTEQALLAEHIDDVLGAMAGDPHYYYNT